MLDKVVIPELGGLRLREVTTSRLDLFLVRLRATSVSRQRKTKVVMGAMLGMAVRHDALAVDPVQQPSRIHRERSETRSLTLVDLTTVREALRAWTAKRRPGPKASSDMADIIDLMLATGARIGEILAVALGGHRTRHNPSEPLHQRNHQDRARQGHLPQGQPQVGCQRADGRPSRFRHRSAQAPPGGSAGEPEKRRVPDTHGTWQQVNNVEGRWRQIRKDTGLDWVTPHTFRKTVATLISERVDAETAFPAARPLLPWHHYISKPASAADVAHVLDELAEGDQERGPNTSGISGA